MEEAAPSELADRLDGFRRNGTEKGPIFEVCAEPCGRPSIVPTLWTGKVLRCSRREATQKITPFFHVGQGHMDSDGPRG